jgi:hypothetical protein
MPPQRTLPSHAVLVCQKRSDLKPTAAVHNYDYRSNHNVAQI